MKQGIKFLLRVDVGMNLSDIEKMEFIFKQGDKKALFQYPSDSAKVIDENTLGLLWTAEDTYQFKPEIIEMDTRITLKNSEYQPETEIVRVVMNKTLFEEVSDND